MPIMRKILIREATNDDKEQLENLFQECFGDIAKNNGALSWIEGRYVVAELHTNSTSPNINVQPKIIAVSGILDLDHSDYNGYEITWTCTTKEYRKHGLIVQILQKCISSLDDDGIPLYCDCWRIGDNPYINMKSVMEHLGMNKVITERIKRVYPYNADCLGCHYKNEKCFCCGDLYMKTR